MVFDLEAASQRKAARGQLSSSVQHAASSSLVQPSSSFSTSRKRQQPAKKRHVDNKSDNMRKSFESNRQPLNCTFQKFLTYVIVRLPSLAAS